MALGRRIVTYGMGWLCLFLMVSFTVSRGYKATDQPPTVYSNSVVAADLTGAWRLVKQGGDPMAGVTVVKIVTDGRFTVASFDPDGKKFMGTYGGTYAVSNDQLIEKLDFSTYDSSQVGKPNVLKQQLKKGQWQLSGTRGGTKVSETWEKMDESTNQTSLAGAWQIRERASADGKMTAIKPGPRQTIKMMSPTRFQWIAFNNETKQFFGTGGGTYTTKDGRYTETIEFFSRDPNRVGMQLSFDYKLEGNLWHHSGRSTTGNPVNEKWVKE